MAFVHEWVRRMMLTGIIKREIKKKSQQAFVKALKQSNMEYIAHLCKYHSTRAASTAQSLPIRNECFESLTLDCTSSLIVADESAHPRYRPPRTLTAHPFVRVCECWEGLKVNSVNLKGDLDFKLFFNKNHLTHLILFLISSGSGGLGRLTRHIAMQPTTITDEIMMPAASTKAANTIVCDWKSCWREIFLFFAWFEVSAGVGSSDIIVSSKRYRN